MVVKKYFKDSQILNDKLRTILYFNLPFSTIIKDRIMPIKIFPKSNSDDTSIQTLLEEFEDKQNTTRQANIILMKVDSEEKDQNFNDDI